MEIYQLKYFEEVAKQKSYTKASEVLAVTQPTLSIAIKKLETELNVTLFEKDGKTTVLTGAGKMLQPIFASILSDASVAMRKADEYNKTMITRTRFGIPMDMCDDLYFAIKDAFPPDEMCSPVGISQLRLMDAYTHLKEDNLDVAMLAKPVDDGNFDWEDYRAVPMVAYMAPDHPYASEDAVTPRMLAETDLLISGRDEGVSGTVIRYMRDNLGKEYMPIKRDLIHTHLLLKSAERNGVAVMADGVSMEGYNLVRRPLDPPLNLELVAAWKSAKHMPDIQRKLIDFIVSYARSQGYRTDGET
jgi:DNA-binding transcriptional LysR family regulator